MTSPTERDLAVDAGRALAVVMVAVGHWLAAATTWRGHTLVAENILVVEPWTQWLTWVVQPVPLLFVLGGWAGARAWAATGTGATTWIAGRVHRLVLPAATFAAVAVPLGLAAGAFGGGAGATAARLLGMPLWFLAVFVPVTAATPLLVAAVRRWGWLVPVAGATAAAGLDVARRVGGLPGTAVAAYAVVWTTAAAIGVAAAVLGAPPARRVAAAGAAALALLVGLVAAGVYPVAMVGAGGESNMSPPTLAVLLLGVFHAAALALAAPRLRAMLARRAIARRVVGTLGAFGMHVYLWHLAGTVVAVGAQRLGVLAVEPGSTDWWATRPLWLAICAGGSAPVVLLAALADRRHLARPAAAGSPGHRRRPLVATILAGGGCAVLALLGLASTWSVAALAALTIAARIARPTPPPPADEGHPPVRAAATVAMVRA
jgi:fucose 4-O-acetylase-like acetyltransferase